MKNNILLAMVIGGGVLGYWGVQEVRVGAGSAAEPVNASLVDLEKGSPLPNNHIRLGPHIRLYNGCVYGYEQSKYATGQPSPGAKVNHAYYAILSEGHPFLAQLQALASRYGSIEKVPDSAVPPIDNFAVLVKTKSFHTIGAIPDEAKPSPEIHGLVINKIESLSGEEKRLLAQGFPKMDFSNVWILEEDRRPSSSEKSMGLLGGGAALVLVGAGMWLWPRLQERRAAAAEAAAAARRPPDAGGWPT